MTMTEENALLTPDLSVADCLARWPQSIQWFLSHQMSCVGCNMAGFDTLQEVAVNYQLSIDDLLSELRQTIQPRLD